MSRRPIPPARALAMLAVLALLAGCSTLSPYSRLTKLDLALSAGERVNPDLNGRPSPVVVRLFELKHPVAFENADFFSLYERPKETLDPDLVTSEELGSCVPASGSNSSSAWGRGAATWACSPPTVISARQAGATWCRSRRKS